MRINQRKGNEDSNKRIRRIDGSQRGIITGDLELEKKMTRQYKNSERAQ